MSLQVDPTPPPLRIIITIIIIIIKRGIGYKYRPYVADYNVGGMQADLDICI